MKINISKSILAAFLAILMMLDGCAVYTTGKEVPGSKSETKMSSSDKDGDPDIIQEKTDEESEVEKVEKITVSENNLSEDKSIYENNDIPPIITMYLDVSKGNAADGSNHTWKEINTYSADDYEKMGVERYKVESILRIDDSGEGLNETSYGFDEVIPNSTVQIRGQTSSRGRQKNYKIRIKDGKEKYNGQRTINLNKHRTEPYRFINKLCYDLLDPIPYLIGGKTRFVHLYVKDLTEDPYSVEEESEDYQQPEVIDGYKDYGLYTMVEQVNRQYLRSRGLDENGQLYKVTFFEWNKNEEIMVPLDDPSYDRDAFEDYLEIKGDEDPEKLQNVINIIHNYTIPIDEIIEEHFDAENICYWMAYNILIGNYDVGARNLFIYSPLNSQKFYFICWDMDDSFKNSYNELNNYNDGISWERGMTKFLVVTLINRMMKEEKYRDMLKAAVDDLHENYITKEIVEEKIKGYKELVVPYVYRAPDVNYIQIEDRQVYEELTNKMADEVDENYNYFLQSLKNPWPFYIDLPKVNKDTNKIILSWGISYDINEEAVTYDYILARDYMFEDVVVKDSDLKVPLATVKLPEPGEYYLKVRAFNKSGYSTDCFDYFVADDYGFGKLYGCYRFIIKDNGEVELDAGE
ncbi:MAG: CotH kinase family protein [Lachnospiraceae bacterium]|nr:CotH kinase family protein [Lachnospiraceae bacterium]